MFDPYMFDSHSRFISSEELKLRYPDINLSSGVPTGIINMSRISKDANDSNSTEYPLPYHVPYAGKHIFTHISHDNSVNGQYRITETSFIDPEKFEPFLSPKLNNINRFLLGQLFQLWNSFIHVGLLQYLKTHGAPTELIEESEESTKALTTVLGENFDFADPKWKTKLQNKESDWEVLHQYLNETVIKHFNSDAAKMDFQTKSKNKKKRQEAKLQKREYGKVTERLKSSIKNAIRKAVLFGPKAREILKDIRKNDSIEDLSRQEKKAMVHPFRVLVEQAHGLDAFFNFQF